MGAEFEVNKVQMKKLRHAERNATWKPAEYIAKVGVVGAAEILKTKLEMWDIGRNYGKERKCKGCQQEERTEHIVECWEVREKMSRIVEMNWIKEESVIPLRKVTEYIKKYIEWRDKAEENSGREME